jgi:hypothetical protein
LRVASHTCHEKAFFGKILPRCVTVRNASAKANGTLASVQIHSDDSSLPFNRHAGLDPRIHGTGTVAPLTVDGRVKPGHDDEVNPVSESKH